MNVATLPLHPSELPRLEGYRPFGFDDFEKIFDWVNLVSKKYEGKSFNQIFIKNKDYIFVNSRNLNPNSPYVEIEVEVGFIDFQDNSRVLISSLKYIMNKKSNDATVMDAINTDGFSTLDIQSVISTICNGRYLVINKKGV